MSLGLFCLTGIILYDYVDRYEEARRSEAVQGHTLLYRAVRSPVCPLAALVPPHFGPSPVLYEVFLLLLAFTRVTAV